MSSFVEHSSCPSCGSRDNLGVFTDHEYCFGCGYILFYNYLRRKELNIPEKQSIVSLPTDIVPYIPAIAGNWLKKYELTTQELIKHRVVWSEYRQLLIFPYFSEDNYLYGYQGRYFGTDKTHPKWTGKGNFKEHVNVYLTNTTNKCILIIEDIISSIKLNRLYNTSCLFGSIIDINKYISIYKKYKPNEFIIWLDRDKRKESYLYSKELNSLGIPTRVMSTPKDPKEYTTEEVKEIIELKTITDSSLL